MLYSLPPSSWLMYPLLDVSHEVWGVWRRRAGWQADARAALTHPAVTKAEARCSRPFEPAGWLGSLSSLPEQASGQSLMLRELP